MHERVAEVTERIRRRSHDARSRYLDRLEVAAEKGKTSRAKLGCANQAHAYAAAPPKDKPSAPRDKPAAACTGKLPTCSRSAARAARP